MLNLLLILVIGGITGFILEDIANKIEEKANK